MMFDCVIVEGNKRIYRNQGNGPKYRGTTSFESRNCL